MQFFEVNEQERQLGNIGRKIMDKAVTEKDDDYANRMCVVGNMLTTVGAPFGKRLTEITSEEKDFIVEISKRYPEIMC